MKKSKAKKPPLTPAQKNHQKDLYYRSKYGISLKDYNRLLRKQKGCCAICHRPPKNNALSVDHTHKFRRLSISVRSVRGNWQADCLVRNKTVRGFAKKRNEAIREVKKQLKTLSVRGLLCFQCNAGLRKYSDDPDRMENAAKYLWKFQNSLQ